MEIFYPGIQTPKPPVISAPTSPSHTEVLLSGRYRDNDDGTVTDVQTGLQWMRCALGQTWRGGTCAGEAEVYQWQAVLEAVEALNRQDHYASYPRWRVPTREELRTLIYCSSGQPKAWNDTGKPCQGDYGRLTMDAAAFPNAPASVFWSASPEARSSDDAWDVDFGVGGDVWDSQSDTGYVRLVQGRQSF